MLQLIFQILILCAVTVIGCFAYFSAVVMRNGGAGIPEYLRAYISESLPLDSLLMVVLQLVFALLVYSIFFKHISNHIIISLDILYLESLLLIFFCHTKKAYRNPLIESMI
jgi:hypothetical protein